MIRLAWRQFRAEGAIGLGVLVVVAVVLAATGPHLMDVYRSTPHQVLTTDPRLQNALAALVLIVPALVGVFFGAPLVARELEAGTYRLAWTQSVTRVRWLAVKLALVGLASSLLVGGLSLMVAWWANPINIVNADRFTPANFGVSGIVPFGYALFAFALGATTGIPFRRTLPAMATTLVGFVGVRLAVTFWIRRPLRRTARQGLRHPADRWVRFLDVAFWGGPGLRAGAEHPERLGALDHRRRPGGSSAHQSVLAQGVSDTRQWPSVGACDHQGPPGLVDPALHHGHLGEVPRRRHLPAGEPLLAVPDRRDGVVRGAGLGPGRRQRLVDPAAADVTGARFTDGPQGGRTGFSSRAFTMEAWDTTATHRRRDWRPGDAGSGPSPPSSARPGWP